MSSSQLATEYDYFISATEQYNTHVRQQVYKSADEHNDICVQTATNEHANPNYFNC